VRPLPPLSRSSRTGPNCRELREVRRDALGCEGSPASTERELAQHGASSAGDLPPGGSACVEATPTTVASNPAGRVPEPSLEVSLEGALGALVWLGCWDAGSALRVWEAWEATLDESVR
jgi:hypothetical protein